MEMEEEYEYVEPTFSDVLTDCVAPSLNDVIYKILALIAYNVMFSVITQTVSIGEIQFHFVSSILGIVLMYNIIEANIAQFLITLLLSHILIRLLHRFKFSKIIKLEYTIAFMCILYILLCEFFHPNQDDWMASRSMFMIAAMKMISLASVLNNTSKNISLLAFFGYMCCPANSIFGPWFTYTEYLTIRKQPIKKDWKWFVYILYTLFTSISFLTLSNCWSNYFVPDENYKWIVGYRKALSFRSSHYFISYLSEAGMIAAGYVDDKHKDNNELGYEITKFTEIELPSSLVNVVVHWNIPMHRFLKKHVYRPTLQFGHFQAVFITFLVSSLLHGLNINLAAVLITIGVYSYIQLKFQETLAVQFNACLGVRSCKSCKHKFKRNNLIVKFALILFSCLTILDLIFLGVLMDYSDDDNDVYSKWLDLDFMGHWVMLLVYLYTYFVKFFKL